jgi:SAM-dependent methyltransferase
MSTDRFTGLAQIYARCRPAYPAAAIDFLLQHCQLEPGAVLVDLGCGTGISARQFAARGMRVLGIEPNADMRRQAETESIAGLSIEIRDGRSEHTGLADDSADAVLAAQAFHWFDHDAALREAHRILRPHGWMAVLFNERDERDPATAAYGATVGGTREAAGVEGPRRLACQALGRSHFFHRAEQRLFEHGQTVDEEGMLGRAFSASYAPREPAERVAFAAALRDVFARFQQDGAFRIKYVTSVDVAQRRP